MHAAPDGALVFAAPLTIGVVADSHVYPHGSRRFPTEVLDLFARLGVGLILHAGDVNTVAVLAALERVAPTLAVQGNNDDDELRRRLPLTVEFTVGRFAFVLIHGHQARTARAAARRYAGRVDCVVYGHSHIPKMEIDRGTLLFNAGSPTERRWQPHFGVGLLRVSSEKVEPDLILFDSPRALPHIT